MSRRIERIWAEDGLGAALLSPLSAVYGAVTAARNFAFDHGLLGSHSLGAPTVSVGNLSVGGTGKTPVSSWVAGQLAQRGARPAILLRGYGDDEPAVHRALLPGAIVVADPDRVRGAAAAREAGATALVLDDAFQHRRAERDLDFVLVAAEQDAAHRLLPAGPLRERPTALRRADLLVVTRKSVGRDPARRVAERMAAAGEIPWALVHLAPGALREWGSEATLVLSTLAGARVLAVSAVGDPSAFESQLRAAGAVVTPERHPDHHPFSARDIERICGAAGQVDHLVCTLKDAVKLGPQWPRGAPRLWYLSQAVEVEEGEATLSALLSRLVPPAVP